MTRANSRRDELPNTAMMKGGLKKRTSAFAKKFLPKPKRKNEAWLAPRLTRGAGDLRARVLSATSLSAP
jgi:hypothetical protein